MSTPTVRPITPSIPSTANRAPFSRSLFKKAARPLRALGGIAFVGYSSVATILLFSQDIAPGIARYVQPDSVFLWSLVCGIILAAVLFIGQIITSDDYLFWYLVLLVPDAWYTYRLSYAFVEAIVFTVVHDETTAQGTAILVTLISAVAVARFGERLLFGRGRAHGRKT